MIKIAWYHKIGVAENQAVIFRTLSLILLDKNIHKK